MLVLVTLAVIGLDQFTKFLVVKDLTHRFDGVSSVGQQLSAMYQRPEGHTSGMFFWPKGAKVLSRNFFEIRYAENTGAAWGLFRDLPENVRGPLFHLISIIAVVVIIFYMSKFVRETTHPEMLNLTGLALILGGAIGNYIDRLSRGFVVDFLEAHWFDKAAWPSFNIADSAICIGAALILLESIRRDKKAQVAASL
jgi:signal peptidase II